MTDGVPGDGLDTDVRGKLWATMRAPLYFEAHVTLDPVFGEERRRVEEIAGYYQFKLAKLVMVKKDGSEELSSRDTFMTGHGNMLGAIKVRLVALVRHLQRDGFAVRRYKIEDTVLDSRTEDVLKLL